MSIQNKAVKKEWIILAFTCVLILTACGKGRNDDTHSVASSVTTAETENTDHTDHTDNTADTDEEYMKEQLAMDEAIFDEASAEGEFEEPDDEEEVADSGTLLNSQIGHFVMVGDEVYFHVPQKSGLSASALWGKYANAKISDTSLVRYRFSEKDSKVLTSDVGYGPMICMDGRIFYQNAVSKEYDSLEYVGEYQIDLTDTDTDLRTLPGQSETLLCGVSDSGIVVSLSAEYFQEPPYSQYTVHTICDGEYDKQYEVSGWYTFVGIAGESIFYLADCSTDYTGELHLIQLDLQSGKLVDLGQMPITEYTAYGEVDQILMENHTVFIGYSFYQGSGHFYAEGFYCKAQIGKSGSIIYSPIASGFETKEGFDATYIPFFVENGIEVGTTGIPGAGFADEEGNVGYYDEKGTPIVVSSIWRAETDPEGVKFRNEVELVEKVGDYLFLIQNYNVRTPEEDVGWRYAYCRKRTSYYAIRIETGEVTPMYLVE